MLPAVSRLRQIPRRFLREQVYLELQTAIVSGRLAPGERIRDQDLATELGVSRTPVREALKRLEDDGLVDSVAGVSTRVTPIEPGAAAEAAPVMAALHALAARLGVPNVIPDHLEQMRAANRGLADAIHRSQPALAIAADDSFHGVLVEASGNRTIDRALRGMRPAIRRLAYQQFGSLTAERSVSQHEEIIKACDARDVDRAAMLVELNWHNLALTLGDAMPIADVAAA